MSKGNLYSFGGSNRNKPQIEPIVIVLVIVGLVIGYAAWQRGRITESDLVRYAVLIPSIILHEISHGALALCFGDRTAKDAGRLSLNPLRHIDPMGTFILPALLVLSGAPAFGWAKPVPVNTSNMSRNQAMLTGLVGPAVNIVIAVVAGLGLNYVGASLSSEQAFIWLLQLAISNVFLATFNLIPIPPLDGASVIERFLPARYWQSYLRFRRYSMLVLIGIFLLSGSALNYVFDPALRLWTHVLTPGTASFVRYLLGL